MTNDELRRLFAYEDHGMLRRIGGHKPYPWRPIGRDGRYLATTVNGVTYYLHRPVYQWHHFVIPEMIDHKDGDTGNNRIGNLRLCSNAQNQYNSPRKCNNVSGHKGVVYHPKCKSRPWQAKIATGGRVVSLGYHETAEKAAEAYAAGAALIAGEFARRN